MTKPKSTLRWLSLGAAAICATLLLNAVLTYHNVLRLDDGQQSVGEAVELKRQLSALFATVVDADVAVRGYVMPGGTSYLDEYARVRSRKDAAIAQVRALVKDDAEQQERLRKVEAAITERFAWLDIIIGIQRQDGRDAVLREVATGHGVKLMNEVKATISDMDGSDLTTLADTTRRAARDLFTTISGLVAFTAVSAALLVLVFFMARREIRVRQRSAESAFDTAQMLRLVIDTIPQRIFWKDLDMRYLGCNKLFAEDAGRQSPSDIVGKTDADLYGADDAARFVAADAKVIADAAPLLDYEEGLELQGRQAWLRISKVPLHDAKGQVIGILGAYEDITARKSADQLLAIRGKALESSVNGIFITGSPDKGSLIDTRIPRLSRLPDTPHRSWSGAIVACSRRRTRHSLELPTSASRSGRAGRATSSCATTARTGSPFWNDLTIAPVRDEDGVITHHIGIVNDVTEQARYQAELEREANFDSLTGLPNRNLLADRLDQMLAHAQRATERLAVVMLDLDNFKFVNDSPGPPCRRHAARQVGRAAEGNHARGAIRSRAMGGDEFVLSWRTWRA